MKSTRWSLVVSEKIDRALRTYLAQRGLKKGDLSRFVEEAVKDRLFSLTVKQVKDRNAAHRDVDILQSIEEALGRG